jgi:tRNA(Ile)-lysidine synthase TilS/MesJ
MIRPLLYASEKSVRQFAEKAELPVVKSTCPADGNTEREEMKQLLHELDKQHKGLRYRIFGAMQRGEIDGFKVASTMNGIKEYDEENDNE